VVAASLFAAVVPDVEAVVVSEVLAEPAVEVEPAVVDACDPSSVDAVLVASGSEPPQAPLANARVRRTAVDVDRRRRLRFEVQRRL
jgi:hypothetical protein